MKTQSVKIENKERRSRQVRNSQRTEIKDNKMAVFISRNQQVSFKLVLHNIKNHVS